MGLILVFFSTFSLLFIIFTFIQCISPKSNYRLPPGPKGWPIIGCLPLLGTMPHAALANLAKKYGPIMCLKLGTSNVVVVSDPDSSKIFLKTLDHNFLSRPTSAGSTHIAYGAQDFVFTDMGPRWKLFRKLSNLHMLGATSYKDWEPIRANEIRYMIQDLYKLGIKGEIIDVPSMLFCIMGNIIGQKSIGRRVFVSQDSETNDFKDTVAELIRLAGLFNIGDFIPSIAWMDLQGIARKMKRYRNKFDLLITKIIEEDSLGLNEHKGNHDFLDIVMANREGPDGLKITMTNVKALLLNLFIAGTDTSAATIEWALAEMIKNPKTMKKAHEEMDRVVGKSRFLKESDLPNLPYLISICKETFRLHPVVPLSLPRLCTNACEANGYYIPKNAMLLINVWAIGRDPHVWQDPLEFNPERFMGKREKIGPWGNNYELLPFGGGRRVCGGMRMGVASLEYILGSLVHSFEWKVPEGVQLDMSDVLTLVLQKAVPLSAVVIPRLETCAYMKY